MKKPASMWRLAGKEAMAVGHHGRHRRPGQGSANYTAPANLKALAIFDGEWEGVERQR